MSAQYCTRSATAWSSGRVLLMVISLASWTVSVLAHAFNQPLSRAQACARHSWPAQWVLPTQTVGLQCLVACPR